jgi:hypothetical protein
MWRIECLSTLHALESLGHGLPEDEPILLATDPRHKQDLVRGAIDRKCLATTVPADHYQARKELHHRVGVLLDQSLDWCENEEPVPDVALRPVVRRDHGHVFKWPFDAESAARLNKQFRVREQPVAVVAKVVSVRRCRSWRHCCRYSSHPARVTNRAWRTSRDRCVDM